MITPVSTAGPVRTPEARTSAVVIVALITSTAAVAPRITGHDWSKAGRSMRMPTVIRKMPSARPVSGAMIASTSAL